MAKGEARAARGTLSGGLWPKAGGRRRSVAAARDAGAPLTVHGLVHNSDAQ